MSDLTLKTSSTNFSKAVQEQIIKNLVQNLRAGLPWLMPGTVIPATYQKGGNGTMRFLSIPDLAVSDVDDFNLVEATTPDGQNLAHDYTEFSCVQRGGFVRWSDLAAMEDTFDVVSAASNRIARQAAVVIDTIARDEYAGETADFFGGDAGSTGAVDTGDTITEDLILAGVAELASRNVERVNGYYLGICSHQLAADLSKLDEYVTAAKFANPQALLNGAVGEFRGVQVIPTSRSIIGKYAGAGGINVHRLVLVGRGAIAAGDFGTLELLSASGATTSDPLSQRATTGWKLFAGAKIVPLDNPADNAGSYSSRTVAIDVSSAFDTATGS